MNAPLPTTTHSTSQHLTAVIIDDEDNSRISLKGKLKWFCPDVSVLAEANGVESGVKALETHHPDMVFLDIKLRDGEGFEILRTLRQRQGKVDPQVIFTTAYDQYAIRAIRFSALDYLLKPVGPEDLAGAVNRAREKKVKHHSNDHMEALMEQLKSFHLPPKKLTISSSEGLHVLEVAKIVRCESQSNYTKFYLCDGSSHLASKTLKEYDELLRSQGFERVHKSHLINLNYLKQYVNADGGYLKLADGAEIPVSNRKKDHLIQLLKSL